MPQPTVIHLQNPDMSILTLLKSLSLEGKKKPHSSIQLFEFAAERLCAKTRSSQPEGSVGRWQLASRNTVQAIDQRHGMA